MAINRHTELNVYKMAFAAAMEVFRESKRFPKEETYSLTDQVRRSSRSVNANLAEAWRKRRYEAHFVSKLSDVETEAAETQVWIQFAVECGYLSGAKTRAIYKTYDNIIRNDRWHD
jgi:four helix bundle protein